MSNSITCGEAAIRLLAKYGVDTVFGIPGVHTLDFCRGLNKGEVRHVQARNEQGAGFMAEGFARATGKPGVALVISGPGVTNATTALGQCYADSIPMLLLSAETPSNSLGKGWGELHEITEQRAVTAPLTALSAVALEASEVPKLFARAFAIFASKRPRPVHISIPIDVLAEMVEDDWQAETLPSRPEPEQDQIEAAAAMLAEAKQPLIMVGGGSVDVGDELTKLAEKLGSIVVSSTTGKGVMPDDHPLALGGGVTRAEVHDNISRSDCVIAIGTELSQPDSFNSHLKFNGKLIRVDIDPGKINDLHPADLGIVADASQSISGILKELDGHDGNAKRLAAIDIASDIRTSLIKDVSPVEAQHIKLLAMLRDCTPPETIFSGDACQIIYTGAFAMPVMKPRQWFFPSGYCALGNALPNAIGAKTALPDTPVIAIAGDGGFMFTVQELMVGAELKMPLPIIIWQNGGYKQIRDDMDHNQIDRVGVEGINPDFLMLARACKCESVKPTGIASFKDEVTAALSRNKPTLILVNEGSNWLK